MSKTTTVNTLRLPGTIETWVSLIEIYFHLKHWFSVKLVSDFSVFYLHLFPLISAKVDCELVCMLLCKYLVCTGFLIKVFPFPGNIVIEHCSFKTPSSIKFQDQIWDYSSSGQRMYASVVIQVMVVFFSFSLGTLTTSSILFPQNIQ